jgi:hypothetical protein
MLDTKAVVPDEDDTVTMVLTVPKSIMPSTTVPARAIVAKRIPE